MRLPVPQQADNTFDDLEDAPTGAPRREVPAARLRDLEAIEQQSRRLSEKARRATEAADEATAQALFLIGERTRMATLIAMMAQHLGMPAFLAPDPSGQDGYRMMIAVQLPAGLVWWSVLNTDVKIPRDCGISDGQTPMGVDRLPPELMYQIVLAPGLSRIENQATPANAPPPVLPSAPAPIPARAADVHDIALPTFEEATAPVTTAGIKATNTCAADGSFHATTDSGCACGHFSAQPAAVPAEEARRTELPPAPTAVIDPVDLAMTGSTEALLPATGPQPAGGGKWGYRCATCNDQEIGIKGRKGCRAAYQAHRAEKGC